MRCKICNTNCIIYRQINTSGSRVVVERCPNCGRNPNTGRPFLSVKDYDWESLPLLEDLSLSASPCAVIGCTNTGTEFHHFAPRHLFDNSDDWPVAWLCREHHREWHEKTLTGAYVTRRVKS
jgi:hypothetical protein